MKSLKTPFTNSLACMKTTWVLFFAGNLHDSHQGRMRAVWWSFLYYTIVKGHLSKNSAPNAMNWQCGMCKIATWWKAEAGPHCSVPILIRLCCNSSSNCCGQSYRNKCPLSGSGGNCYTYLDLKHGCKYLATCQWKHSQEGYLNCQRMTTKTNSHEAVWLTVRHQLNS